MQEPDMVNSPGGTRRRRSRIPSEEDDQLINFLVTGQNDGKSDKNLSVGNLVAESQQNYGSLDRGLMRRSRFVIDFNCFVRPGTCVKYFLSFHNGRNDFYTRQFLALGARSQSETNRETFGLGFL